MNIPKGCLLAALGVLGAVHPSTAENRILKKTGNAIGSVKDTLTQPITDPKAAFSRWFDFNPEIERGERRNFNVLPLFVSSPERGQGFGVKYAQESLLNEHDIVRAHALQTLKNRAEFRLEYEFPPELFERLGAEFAIAYENYDRYYYGIGNRTPESNKSEYRMEFFEARLPLLYRVRDRVFAGLSFNFENFKIVEAGYEGVLRADMPRLVGNDRSRLYTTSFFLRWDSRNHRTNPSRGFFIEANEEYSKKLLGSETDFTRSTLEARFFTPILGRNSHVFACKFFADYKNGDVPFHHLPSLGGVFYNRGLIEGRFRDTLAVSGNYEYRFKIYERLHWAFFIDTGNVFREFHAVTFLDPKVTGGTGMRYYVPPGNLLLARVDGGYSTEGFLVYLTFDHPF